jgi:hypothetical protein
MLKQSKFFTLFVTAILVSSIGVYAAGTSTDATDSAAAATNTDTVRPARVTDCETKDTREDRIKCRLKKVRETQSEEEYGPDWIPEACRRLKASALTDKITTKEDCKRFYRSIQNCYDKTGRDKFSCFRRAAGLSTAAISGQSEKKAEMRKYIVELLYDLQERIENAVEEGNVNEDDAAPLIDSIVEIKHKIMDGAPRSEVKPLIDQFKEDFRKFRSSLG